MNKNLGNDKEKKYKSFRDLYEFEPNKKVLVLAQVTTNTALEKFFILSEKYILLANGQVLKTEKLTKKSFMVIADNKDQFMGDPNDKNKKNIYCFFEDLSPIIQGALKYKLHKALNSFNHAMKVHLITEWGKDLRYISSTLPLDMQALIIAEINKNDKNYQASKIKERKILEKCLIKAMEKLERKQKILNETNPWRM